jgi:hypothetical protein
MTMVNITCTAIEEAAQEAGAAPGYVPAISVEGEVVWRGKALSGPEEAERVALDYLRYGLGGLLMAPEAPAGAPPRADEAERKSVPAAADELVDRVREELLEGLRRITQFLESGDWRRFLR